VIEERPEVKDKNQQRSKLALNLLKKRINLAVRVDDVGNSRIEIAIYSFLHSNHTLAVFCSYFFLFVIYF